MCRDNSSLLSAHLPFSSPLVPHVSYSFSLLLNELCGILSGDEQHDSSMFFFVVVRPES